MICINSLDNKKNQQIGLSYAKGQIYINLVKKKKSGLYY